jgi:hypothetical protein
MLSKGAGDVKGHGQKMVIVKLRAVHKILWAIRFVTGWVQVLICPTICNT